MSSPPPPAVAGRTAYLALWVEPDEPVLVACPELPDVLLEPKDARLAETLEGLHSVVWEMVDRLNIVAPSARALAARRGRDAD